MKTVISVGITSFLFGHPPNGRSSHRCWMKLAGLRVRRSPAYGFGQLAFSNHQATMVPDSWVILSFMALLSQQEGRGCQTSCCVSTACSKVGAKWTTYKVLENDKLVQYNTRPSS